MIIIDTELNRKGREEEEEAQLHKQIKTYEAANISTPLEV